MVPTAAQFQSSYSSIRCPVRGTGDQISEPEQAQRLHEAAGHMVTYADARAIADALTRSTALLGANFSIATHRDPTHTRLEPTCLADSQPRLGTPGPAEPSPTAHH